MNLSGKHPVLCTILGLFLLGASPAYAGAWAQEDRGMYLKLSTSWEQANQQYKEDGDTFQLLSEDDSGDYRALSTTIYGEFGIVPRLTAITSASMKSMTVESQTVRATTTGLSDFQFGLKYQFLDKPFVASFMASGRFPMGYSVAHPDPRTPALGNGVAAAEGTLLIGKSFYPAPIYVSGEVTFRYRGERANGPDYPPEVPMFFELGYGPTEWIWLRAVVDANWGLGNPESIDTVSFAPSTQRYVHVGPSAIVTVAEKYQFNIDYYFAPWGVNSLRSHTISVGFALDTTL